jgi:hypothetical protein
LVESTTRHTHAPNKVRNVKNVLLMGFGGKDNGGTPRSVPFANPPVAKQDFNVLHDDLAPSHAARSAASCNRQERGAASFKSQFEAKNGEVNPSRRKLVPFGTQ